MGQRDIFEIVEELRNCGTKKVDIDDLLAGVHLNIRGFVKMFAKQKDKWVITEDEKYKTVNIEYQENGITYSVYVPTYSKMKEIADYVGLKYGNE